MENLEDLFADSCHFDAERLSSSHSQNKQTVSSPTMTASLPPEVCLFNSSYFPSKEIYF